jgi:hypothetical protein
MRFLLLTQDGDATAARIADALARRHGAESAAVVTMRELAEADQFTLGVTGGRSYSAIRLKAGTTIKSAEVGIVMNRLRHVLVPQFVRAALADRSYATMEMYALLIGWLTSLPCPIVNRGGSSSLSGIARGPLEWFALAARAGLRTPRVGVCSSARIFPARDHLPLADNRPQALYPALASIAGQRRGWCLEPLGPRRCSVYVAGSRVWGPLSQETHAAVRRLTERAGMSLARVDFCETHDVGGSWMFVGIDEWPELIDPGAIDAATAMLEDLSRGEKAEAR